MTKWQKIKCFILGLHSWRVVASGYPAHQKKWTLVQYCKKCKKWQTIRDNKKIPLRDVSKFPMDENFLTFEMIYNNQINFYKSKIRDSYGK